ncbi:hypothetical protein S40285_10428 [Stachybotrys chlorohalonatus IBT 40285]|uniref:Uncharacterized protein n=1 Tax=Stachybotrys chlorohalonatus (strain IBT 40285) TaxID=1283841 RepID=A0A084QED4_STAC4|nr:hypothetical protein S40285_10428 [Stachybotrys chlorohalonata IBT 40285]
MEQQTHRRFDQLSPEEIQYRSDTLRRLSEGLRTMKRHSEDSPEEIGSSAKRPRIAEEQQVSKPDHDNISHVKDEDADILVETGDEKHAIAVQNAESVVHDLRVQADVDDLIAIDEVGVVHNLTEPEDTPFLSVVIPYRRKDAFKSLFGWRGSMQSQIELGRLLERTESSDATHPEWSAELQVVKKIMAYYMPHYKLPDEDSDLEECYWEQSDWEESEMEENASVESDVEETIEEDDVVVPNSFGDDSSSESEEE